MRKAVLGGMLGMAAALAITGGVEPVRPAEAMLPPPPPREVMPPPPREEEPGSGPPLEHPPEGKATRRERSAHGHKVDTLWRQASRKREAAKGQPVDRRRVMAKQGKGS